MAEEGLAERVRRTQADAARMVGKNLRTAVLAAGCGSLVLLFGSDLVIRLFSALGLAAKRSDTTGLIIAAGVLCGAVLLPALGTTVVQAVIWAKARRVNARVARNPELAALIVPPSSGQLAALKAGGPLKMTIEGKNKVEIADILVGEVWICSGQSNME